MTTWCVVCLCPRGPERNDYIKTFIWSCSFLLLFLDENLINVDLGSRFYWLFLFKKVYRSVLSQTEFSANVMIGAAEVRDPFVPSRLPVPDVLARLGPTSLRLATESLRKFVVKAKVYVNCRDSGKRKNKNSSHQMDLKSEKIQRILSKVSHLRHGLVLKT